MGFDPQIAEIRFGCGLSPKVPAPQSAAEMLARLTGPDTMAAQFPIAPFTPKITKLQELRVVRRTARREKTEDAKLAVDEKVKEVRQTFRGWWNEAMGHTILRRVMGEDGLRERLVAFWSDHFTAIGGNILLRMAYASYTEDAIRPHVTGHFADMLRATTTHPYMLWFLDQATSMGENSASALYSKRGWGINENLAREMLELHTLGVGSGYTQTDVRQLAELLTGLTVSRDPGEEGFWFNPRFVEPGAETVLSKTYGGEGDGTLEDIYAVLDDLAKHPATARHIARKLAVHFVSDTPDEALVAAMEAAYLDSDGHLPTVYAALLEHPAAWSPEKRNVKQPMDFVASSLRALDIHPRHMPMSHTATMRRFIFNPLALMGQPPGHPVGPDGFPEDDIEWITPQRLAARVQWAMVVPFKLMRVLPDPRDFAETALGGAVPEPVRFAAAAAETRAEGVGLVLASPAFQRM